MTEPIDQEVEAIKAVLLSLTPLSDKARISVMDYVAKRLSVPQVAIEAAKDLGGTKGMGKEEQPVTAAPHIEEFKAQKQPRSANEMAALIAFYLENIAPATERKKTVNQKDMETYFKIASFTLPKQVRMTLQNAKNAGYFDLVGVGEYKLNAVGYNLVAHSMPRVSGTGTKGAKSQKENSENPIGTCKQDKPHGASKMREFLREVLAFVAQLKSRHTVSINDKETKARTIALATKYFQDYRVQVLKAMGPSGNILSHDEKWQNVVRLAHGNNKRKTYLNLLGCISKELTEFSVVSLVKVAETGSPVEEASDLSPSERQLVSTLDALLPTAAASYRQGLLDLREKDRLSYRGTASEFREALREVLDHLAPDEEVMAQTGFKLEDGQGHPTMKQKTRFVLISRGRGTSQRTVAEKSIGLIESISGEVVRAAYDRASLAAHLETTRAEVLRIKRYVNTVLYDLLEVPEFSGTVA